MFSRKPTVSPYFDLRPIEGKGHGLVALRKIVKGHVIFKEGPLIQVSCIDMLRGTIIYRLKQILKPHNFKSWFDAETREKYLKLDKGPARYASARIPEPLADTDGNPITAADEKKKLEDDTYDETHLFRIWETNAFLTTTQADLQLNALLQWIFAPLTLSFFWSLGLNKIVYQEINFGFISWFLFYFPALFLSMVLVGVFFDFQTQVVYEKASRLNHSCDANAVCLFEEKAVTDKQTPGVDKRVSSKGEVESKKEGDEKNNRPSANTAPKKIVPMISIATIRDIAVGEEILIDYLRKYSDMTHDKKREILEYDYGIDCKCRICEAWKLHQQRQQPVVTQQAPPADDDDDEED